MFHKNKLIIAFTAIVSTNISAAHIQTKDVHLNTVLQNTVKQKNDPFYHMIANISDALAHYPSNAPAKGKYQHLLANILPMNKTKLNEFWDDFEYDPSVFQYSFDSIRYPLYFGQQCLVDYQSPICQMSLPNLTAIVKTASQYSKTLDHDDKGKMPSMGFWAYDVSSLRMGYDAAQYCFEEGCPVIDSEPTDDPLFLAPTAVAALVVSSIKDDYFNALIKELSAYDLDQHSPWDINKHDPFTWTTQNYFNATLLLLSQGFMVDYVSKQHIHALPKFLTQSGFMENYRKFTSDNNGFIERFRIDGVTYARVIFSSKTAPHKRSHVNAGQMPTVSEGMAYGLLISYLANDQVLFDQLLRYVLAVSKNHGCALYYDHICHQKSDLLMPWITDIEGKPFYYKDEDGTSALTNDSASDADVNIGWAIALAAQNVLDGKWTSSLFRYGEESLAYWQLAQHIKQQIRQFDGYQHARFFDKTYNWFMTPGNQWSESGKEVLYSGYFMPQAFLMLSRL